MTGILFGPISVSVAVNSVCSSAAAAAAAPTPPRRRPGRGDRDRGRGGDAVALLEALDELGELEDGHLVDGLEQIVLGEDCHVWVSFVVGRRGRPGGRSCVVRRAVRRRRPRPSGRGPGPARSRDSGCSRSSSPARVAIGGCIPPASLARRTSRDGRLARLWTPSASIVRSPSTAPVIVTTLYGRVASMTALAVVDSSFPKAIAVGPMRSGPRASPIVSWAAIRMRRFLTTRYDTSCLRRARRISAISLTVRPRYSETISVRLPASACLQLGDRLPLGLGRHVVPPVRRAAGARRWASSVRRPRRPCDGACSAGLIRRGAATARVVHWSCLGVLAVVPGRRSLGRRSDPADQAPTVSSPRSDAVRGRRLSLAVPSSSVVATRLARAGRRRG